jgi:hypothetical protein
LITFEFRAFSSLVVVEALLLLDFLSVENALEIAYIKNID